MFDPYLLAFCRFTIGFMFLVSATGKLRDVKAFIDAIANFNLLPSRLNTIAAYLFICGEVVVVATLTIGGVFLSVGFLLAICLLLFFSVALVISLGRKMSISCNCFGVSKSPISMYDLWRNGVFIVCAVVGYKTQSAAGSLSILDFVLLALLAATFDTLFTQLGVISFALRQL